MNRDQRRLAALWGWVRTQLPPAPATVVEVGCGSLGGFVPALRDAGYQAIGIDPHAPDGADYRREPFEQIQLRQPAAAVVACTSLHHVADLDVTLDAVARALTPGGVFVVFEWSWERFDEPTAHWAFARLISDPEEPSWLHQTRDAWLASGLPWASFLQQWGAEAQMHTSEIVLQRLADHFEPRHQSRTRYLFHDLDGTTEADEEAAIEAGLIQATGAQFVGVRS